MGVPDGNGRDSVAEQNCSPHGQGVEERGKEQGSTIQFEGNDPNDPSTSH